MDLHPSGDPVVVPGGEPYPIAGGGVRDALAAAPVPDGGVRHALAYLPPPQPGMLPLQLPDLPELLLRRPFHALVGIPRAAVEFQDPIQDAVIVHSPVAQGKGLVVAEIVAAADPPAPPLRRVHIQGRDHMGEPPLPQRLLRRDPRAHAELRIRGQPQVLEELALEDVPFSVEPGIPQLRRQALQLPHIVRLALHEGFIIRDQALDEAIVLRDLPGLVLAVDEEPLDVAMADTAGVAGIVDPLWKVIDTAQGSHDLPDPFLPQLGGLVQEDHIIFRALILVQVPVRGAVAEADGAAPGEIEHPLRLHIPGDAGKLCPKGLDMVVLQLLISPSYDQQLDAGIAQTQPLGLIPDAPALAAAPGTSEEDMLVPVPEELRLLLAGPLEHQFIH